MIHLLDLVHLYFPMAGDSRILGSNQHPARRHGLLVLMSIGLMEVLNHNIQIPKVNEVARWLA